MKKWMFKILVFVGLVCTNMVPVMAQNTLNLLGLSSGAPSAAAFSLRKLSDSYSGPLVRILVGTNFYDVYPDATSGAFATTSLISSAQSTYNAAVASAGASALSSIITAGSTNATVAIWYDQSGYGINVLQATTAKQPSIITSGTINTYSGKPTMYFNASNTGGVYFQSATSYQSLNSTPYTLSAVCQTPSGGSGTHNTAIGTGNSGAANRSLNFGYNSTTGNVLKIGQGSNTSSFVQIPQNTKLTLLTGIRNNTGGASAFLNGNASGSSQMSNPGTSPTYSTQYLATNSTIDYLNIGAGYTPGAFDWIGNISEVILFPGDLSASRSTFESNQSAYYDVPLISSQPSTGTQTLCVNATATAITVTASATSSLSYQWYSNTTNSNITGGVSLGSTGGAQTSSYTPSTAAAGTLYYYCIVTNATSGANTVSNVSGAITVNALPTPTFTAQPGATACASTDVTYTTESGQSNYIWTLPGILNVDYSITSGGIGTSSNTVTLKWLTAGSKTVTINYTTNGCTAASATSSTATTVNALPTPTFTAQPGTSASESTNVTYTTQSGQSNYVWTVPGTLSTDYTISSGGLGTTSNTVTLKWLTTGSKTVTINYTNANGCSGATSSIATTVSTLDQLGLSGIATAVAYSVRKLSSNYSGPLVRIYNGSSYYDVYPDATTGWIASTSLLSASIATYNADISAVGSTTLSTITDATVAVWYDQSGNARHIYQATTANQPIIITSSVIKTNTSGKPAAYFNGTSTFLQTTAAATWLNGIGYSIVSVMQKNGTGSFTFVIGTNDGNTDHGLHFGQRSSTKLSIDQFGDGADYIIPQIASTTIGTIIKYAGAGGSAAWLNGTPLGTNTSPNANLATTGVLNVGTGYNTGGNFWLGPVSELLIFPNELSTTNRQTVESNQATNYSVSLQTEPIISVQPSTAAQLVCLNTIPSNLSVTASVSTGTISYQWYKNATNSNTSGGVSLGSANGAQTNTLTPITSVAGTTYYYCILTSSSFGFTSTSTVSGAVSVNSNPTFTAQPGATTCVNTDVTYTTESGQTNYVWTLPGTLNVDYSITSGGIGTSSNTVTLQWLTAGSKTVTINYTNATYGCTAASATSSTATTVSAKPTPTFTAQPGATACASTDVTYTTESGQSNYIWTVPGTLSTDYTITSGGVGTTSNTVTLKWLTTGSKTVTITYTSSGCTAATATSSTATTVNALPTPTFTAQPGATACASTDVTYTTEASQTNYVWTLPGILNVDYSITSGGIGTSSNTVTLKWLTAGSKTVTINYTNSNGCAAVSATSSTAITVSAPSVPGTISGGGVSVVSGSNSTTLTLSGYTGTIQWQSSTTSSSSGFSDISGATSATYTATNLTATTYYQAVVTSGVCTSATASSVSISMLTAPSISYGVSGTQTYATNSAISQLTVTNTGGTVSGVYKQVSVFAGSGSAGFNDGTGTSAAFNALGQIAVNSAGDLFVTDGNNNRIRKITAAGVVTTFAGSGDASSTDGQGTAATFNSPQGIAINAQGDIFVADTYGNKIRKITASGAVSTFAGTGSIGSSDNATGTSATFGYPWGLCFDASGNLFVADVYSQKIRKITPAGAVSTYGSSQYYIGIRGMAFDNAGNLYVSSNGNGERLIYKITPSQTVSVFVGGTLGDVDGNGTSVKTGSVSAMQFGNDNYIYFTDTDKNKIKRMSLSADVTTVVGGTILDGNGSSTTLSNPYGFVFDGLGNAYTSEYSGNTIKKISFLGYTISPSLPSGLSFSGSNGTISGTPTTTTAATTYTITAINAAGSSSTTVSLATGPTNTITLSSAAGTNAQTQCNNTAITNISYNTTSATGATFSGLPTGVSGAWLANVVTISGTPTVAGSYSYTVTLTGGIGTVTTTGSITVSETPVIASQSTTTQTVCQNATAANFSVTATGSGTKTYQWYSNTSASTTSATNLGSANGAQTATYTPQTSATGTQYYYCVVTMGTCSATSAFSGAVVVTPLSVSGSISGAGGTCYGTTKTLTLSGNTGTTIQWQLSTTSSSSGFSNISGETASTYVVPSTAAVGTYYYQAVVTNGVCSPATTASVTVNVNALPVIASQSTATQTVCQNVTAAAFTVTATDAGALTYQWFSNASNNNTSGTTLGTVTGAQTATYTPSTLAAGTLYYYCIVTNSNGCTATSAVSGAVVVNAVPVVAGVAQAGGFGNGLNLDGGNDHVSVATVSGLNFNVTNEITVEAWVKVIKDGCDFWLTMGSGFNYRFGTCDNIPYWDMGQHSDKTATNVTLTDNTWYHMAFSASMVGSTIKTNVYIDGTLRYTQDEGITTLPASTLIRLGAGEYSIYHNFKGTMDEVRIWNTARTQAQIQASMNTELAGTETGLVAYYNFNNGTAGGTNTGITTLTDRTSNANNGTLTNFALTGSTSNWVDGATLSGASTLGAVCVNSTIQLSNATTGGTWSTSDATIATVDNTGLVTGIAAGSVTISYTVTNASNCSTTATTPVTVNALPVITSQSTATQRIGQNGTAGAFSVTATGTSLIYQWYSNTTASNTGGTLIGTATSSTYTPPTATVGTTYYYCIVTNASGCIATSAVSGAVIIEQMYITSTGTIGTVCYSSSAQTSTLAYTATANNPTSYSIDWNAAANTAGLADQSSTIYTFASGSGTIPDIAISAGATAGTYSGTLTIRNANNITATLAVTITINPMPTITTSGTATAKCFSTSAQTTSLVYSATTQSPISYSIDWSAAANTAGLTDQTTTSYSFVAGGGTLSSIAIPASIPGGTYTGTMTITNANGCANTQAISYTSYALPIAGIRNNTSTTVLTSTVTSISLTATGGSTYSWSNGSSVVSTTAAYRVTAPGTYTVTVTNANGCSSTTSITITQTSTPPASSITNNTGTTELNCTTSSISLTATGGGTYSWSNGTSVVGTSAGLTVTAPGTYTVTVTNGGSTSTSSITITQNVVTSATAVLTGSTTITSGKSANLQATISIGNAPYTVVISDGTTQFTTYSYYSGPNIVVTPSATKTYTLVSVTGANGCAVTGLSGSATVTVNGGGTSKVWTGAAGDDLWSTGGNWSPAGTPASNDFITIPLGMPQLDVYFTVTGSLTVNGTGTLTVNAGKSIDIGAEGVVDFGKRDITFKSSSTGTAQLGKIEGSLSNADSVIVERYFPAGRRAYRFISASVTTPSSIRYNWMENATPVYSYGTTYTTVSAYNPKLGYGTHITGAGANTNGFDRTALNTSTLYTLNTTTQAWVAVGSTAGTLAAGDAYRILIRGDRAINLNNNNTFANATTIRTKGAPKVGLHTVSSSLSTTADGWSLVGNPYQALVDLRGVSTTNLTPYYSIWDPQRGTRGSYVSYHLGTGIKSNVASDVNELLQPGQAFFVQTLNAGAATLTFEESNKAPLGTQTSVFRPIANYPVLNVAMNYTDSLANGAPEMDAFAVVFDNSFSNSVDKEDGPKNYNQDDNMGISRDGKLLAMELRDMYNATTVIPMDMVNYVRTDYTLRINWSNPVDAGYEAYLKDNYTGAMQPISFSSNTDYVFTVNSSIAASKATDRFSVLFVATATLPVSGLVLNGAAEGKQVKLQFDALSEREMAGYTIERSADGISFEKIGEQAAVNGNVASRSYAFIDNKPITGSNYYRIVGTSLNGQVQYSNVKLIKVGNSMPTVLVAPNPAGNDKLQLKVVQLLKGSYTLTVTDALGRIFCQKELVYDGVSGKMELKFPSVAKSGSYYVKVNGEGGSFTEAFIIR